MNVLDAITNRRSIRAFRPDPVPKETLEQILQIAQRAPSGTNTQPWHVYVCAGAVKQAITDDVLALVRSGGGKKYEDHGYYPADWKPEHRDRRRGVGWSLYSLLGIAKGDRVASARQGARNFQFFDAPVGLFVTTDARRPGSPSRNRCSDTLASQPTRPSSAAWRWAMPTQPRSRTRW